MRERRVGVAGHHLIKFLEMIDVGGYARKSLLVPYGTPLSDCDSSLVLWRTLLSLVVAIYRVLSVLSSKGQFSPVDLRTKVMCHLELID